MLYVHILLCSTYCVLLCAHRSSGKHFEGVFRWCAYPSCLQEVTSSMKAGGKREVLTSPVLQTTAGCLNSFSFRISLKLICFLLQRQHLQQEHVGRGGNGRAHGSSKEAIKIAVVLSKVHLSKSDLQMYTRQHPFTVVETTMSYSVHL